MCQASVWLVFDWFARPGYNWIYAVICITLSDIEYNACKSRLYIRMYSYSMPFWITRNRVVMYINAFYGTVDFCCHEPSIIVWLQPTEKIAAFITKLKKMWQLGNWHWRDLKKISRRIIPVNNSGQALSWRLHKDSNRTETCGRYWITFLDERSCQMYTEI